MTDERATARPSAAAEGQDMSPSCDARLSAEQIKVTRDSWERYLQGVGGYAVIELIDALAAEHARLRAALAQVRRLLNTRPGEPFASIPAAQRVIEAALRRADGGE